MQSTDEGFDAIGPLLKDPKNLVRHASTLILVSHRATSLFVERAVLHGFLLTPKHYNLCSNLRKLTESLLYEGIYECESAFLSATLLAQTSQTLSKSFERGASLQERPKIHMHLRDHP